MDAARPGLFEQAREGTFRQLDRQKERAATGLASFVDVLRESGRHLEGQNATVASYVDAAAGQVERFAGGLRDRDAGQMVTDLEQFARRRPAVFLGSAFVLGLVAARFLKSSTESSRTSSMPTTRTSYMPPTPPTPPTPTPTMPTTPRGYEPLA